MLETFFWGGGGGGDGLNFFFSYKREKAEKSARNEIFRQMPLTLTLLYDVK